MANWIIDFQSIALANYRIQIDGAPGDTDVRLIPSNKPFFIEEEGKKDLFLPVKTQSGYVEIMTDDFSLLKQILPSRGGVRQVWVGRTEDNYHTFDIVFKGYVQPKILSFKIWKGHQKLRIPIECELSALRYMRSGIASSKLLPVYTLLGKLLETGHSIPFDTVYIQGNILTDYPHTITRFARAWLLKEVYNAAYFDNSRSRLDILKRLCTFFGWTARSMGTKVYVLSNRNIDDGRRTLIKMSPSDLTYGDFSNMQYASYQEQTFVDGAICDNNLTATYIEGVHEAKATCQLEYFESELRFPDTPIKESINEQRIKSREYYVSDYTEEAKSFTTRLQYVRVAPTSSALPMALGDEWQLVQMENVQVLLDGVESQDVQDWTYHLRLFLSGTFQFYEDPQSPERYWRIVPQQILQGTLVMASTVTSTFSENGKLTISFDATGYLWKPFAAPPELILEESSEQRLGINIRIGNLWYDSQTRQWRAGSAPTPLYFTVDNNVKVPVTAGMEGNVILYIYKGNYIERWTDLGCVDITGVSIEYAANTGGEYDSDLTDVEYTAVNNDFTTDASYETLTCVKEPYMRQSKNILMNPGGLTQCPALFLDEYVPTGFNPLQRLADQVITETALQHTCLEIPVRRDMMAFAFDADTALRSLIYIQAIDAWFYPSAISYNAVDEVVTMKLIERTYGTDDDEDKEEEVYPEAQEQQEQSDSDETNEQETQQ